IDDTSVTNTSGVITVASGGTLTFTDVSGSDIISGGTLNNNSGGTIKVGTASATAAVTIENENVGSNIFTNSGQLTVASSSALTLTDETVTNTNGIITVASGGTLTFTDVSGSDLINGGQLNNNSGGTIKVGTASATAAVTIENENSSGNVFTNSGQLTIASGSTLTLTDDKVENASGSGG